LTFVAIAAALSQGAPLRLLIFDELGRLDAKRRVVLIEHLQRALAQGWIDQFIVSGAVELPTVELDERTGVGPIQVIEL
jgi:hypothetical protein